MLTGLPTPARWGYCMAEAVTKRVDADECQKNADECRALARAVKDPSHRTMLEHMANTWERLARSFRTGR